MLMVLIGSAMVFYLTGCGHSKVKFEPIDPNGLKGNISFISVATGGTDI
jgi:hypothetical protein